MAVTGEGVALDPDRYLVLPDQVNLTNCDREQIHLSGGVQPHGAVVVVDPSDGAIVACSDNVGTLLNVEQPAIGSQLAGLQVDGILEVAASVDTAGSSRRLRRVTTSDGRGLDAVLHRMTGLAVIEFEPSVSSTSSVELIDVVHAADMLSHAESVAEARQLAVDLVRNITGFDRVMLYSFHADGHGEVVTESRAPAAESFLGLHYPATDIPRQARALYLRNWTRLIVDTAAEPVPIRPAIHPMTQRPLNLALSQLRAVSPIHLEYLRNMGVGASMSLSLVNQDELVGLIACHHDSPRHITYTARSSCELIARLLSELLVRTEAAEQTQLADARRIVQMRVLRFIAEADDMSTAMQRVLADTLELFDADAAVAVVAGVRHSIGEMPVEPSALVPELDDDHPVWATERAGEHSAFGDDAEGGLLVARLAADGDFVAWWRAPVTRSVVWAGNPAEGVDAGGEKLTPRASFAAWTETMQGASAPWRGRDLDIARSLAATIRPTGEASRDVAVVLDALTSHARHLEAVNGDLRRLVAERDVMLGAVAHDLRGPLRAVGTLTDVLVAKGSAPGSKDDSSLREIGERITDSVQHISGLLDGVQQWGRVGEILAPTDVNLEHSLQTVMLALQADLDDAIATVLIGELPTVWGEPSLLRELFQNLMENAIRYRSATRRLVLEITADWDGALATITVADNGIGIAEKDQASIFELFSQVAPGKSAGRGLGLALVQRIAEAHRGRVTVDSTPGEGSAFHVHLPRRMVNDV